MAACLFMCLCARLCALLVCGCVRTFAHVLFCRSVCSPVYIHTQNQATTCTCCGYQARANLSQRDGTSSSCAPVLQQQDCGSCCFSVASRSTRWRWCGLCCRPDAGVSGQLADVVHTSPSTRHNSSRTAIQGFWQRHQLLEVPAAARGGSSAFYCANAFSI